MAETVDYTLLFRIASAYYKQGMSQQEISSVEHISRPHVSRMLAKARECGIVRISVEMPDSLQLAELSERTKELFSLQEVFLAYVPSEQSGNMHRVSEYIAAVAAESLPKILRGHANIGVGWGSTVYRTSLKLSRGAGSLGEEACFVPLIGISGENNPCLQVNILVDRFAEHFGASSFYTNLPVVVDNNLGIQQVNEKHLSRLSEKWESLDATIIGLGAPFRGGEFILSEASQQYKDAIRSQPLVGDILASFFYADGTVYDSSAVYYQIALDIKRLSSIQTVVCLAGGPDKAMGLYTAARCGYYNALITDNNTALKMCQYAEKEGARP